MMKDAEPKTFAGMKVIELPLPDGVEFALVSGRRAAICVTGGEIVMAELSNQTRWEPKE
jgi:hypothetical protein